MLEQFFQHLPGFVLGTLILILFIFIGRAATKTINQLSFDKKRRPHLPLILGRLAHGLSIILGMLLAATAAFPSFTPTTLFTFLGVGSVAIGFAFRDILQNYLAGVLLLVTEPFRIGDQIIFGDHEGTVEDIQARATLLKTYDGRRVVIPNGNLFVESVVVNTAFEIRRSQFDVGIGYGDEISTARQLMLDAIKSVSGVCTDPPADVLLVSLSDYSVNLRARWWTSSKRIEMMRIQDTILELIKKTLTENGIDIPFPTSQILFHDQTDAHDGDRTRQREGWPARKETTANPPPIRQLNPPPPNS